MDLEFDLTVTAVIFIALIAVGTAGTFPMMPAKVVFMMVLPSMVVFGFVMLVVGVKHGEYRAKKS